MESHRKRLSTRTCILDDNLAESRISRTAATTVFKKRMDWKPPKIQSLVAHDKFMKPSEMFSLVRSYLFARTLLTRTPEKTKIRRVDKRKRVLRSFLPLRASLSRLRGYQRKRMRRIVYPFLVLYLNIDSYENNIIY